MTEIDKIEQEWIRKIKINKRIKANRIVAGITFRDHFSSNPGRHSWDLCGHPVYYWTFKAALECKYFEKILLRTEVKEAWNLAREMSDKFVIIERSLEECKEPQVVIEDDLKNPKSRRIRCEQDKQEIYEALEIEAPILVGCGANCPLRRAESLDKLIEVFFEDDFAEQAQLVRKMKLSAFWFDDPNYPNYLLPLWQFSGYVTQGRQQAPSLYEYAGATILMYQEFGIHRTIKVEIPWEEGVEIHDREDFELCEFYMKKRLKNEQKNC